MLKKVLDSVISMETLYDRLQVVALFTIAILRKHISSVLYFKDFQIILKYIGLGR